MKRFILSLVILYGILGMNLSVDVVNTSCISIVCSQNVTIAADINPALQWTFGNEGGYTVDQGGPTKYGISQHSYPNLNIKALTLSQAAKIYERDYWSVIKADQYVSQIIANEAFDAAVNMGESFEVRLIQQSCNLAYWPEKPIAVDGVIGKETLKRINGKNQDLVYVNMIGLRYQRYLFLVTNNPKKYMSSYRSWTKRVKNNVRHSVHAYDIYLKEELTH